jgi:hypothetical protein
MDFLEDFGTTASKFPCGKVMPPDPFFFFFGNFPSPRKNLEKALSRFLRENCSDCEGGILQPKKFRVRFDFWKRVLLFAIEDTFWILSVEIGNPMLQPSVVNKTARADPFQKDDLLFFRQAKQELVSLSPFFH